MSKPKPIIGITADIAGEKVQAGRAYARSVVQAGGLPVVLPPIAACAADFLAMCDGFVFTGGDDPDMTRWGIPMHPKATAMDADRQAFELELLRLLDQRPETPVLGVCLGMQLMGLHAGGRLEQYLPDVLPTAGDHWDRRSHAIRGDLGQGMVHSHHRQALNDPGRLAVIATAPDGVIEAVRDSDRSFYVGVQWHPERTEDRALGQALFEQLIARARASRGE